MSLEEALLGMKDAQAKLATLEGVNNPIKMSLQMSRLAQFTGVVETYLAELEKELEVTESQTLHHYLLEMKLPVTQAEKRTKIDLGEIKGQVKYLTRLVGSAWRSVCVVQSRWNHLAKELGTNV